jgi:hypothetical protein
MRGPWTSSFGLHPVESQMNGGKGLSVPTICPEVSDCEWIFAVTVYLEAVHLALSGHLGYLTIADRHTTH